MMLTAEISAEISEDDAPESSPGANEEEDSSFAGVEEALRSPPRGLWRRRGGLRRRRLSRKRPLVDFDNLPEYLRDNEYILKHYRADWPLKSAFFSLFYLHNESLNIWTHLAGFLLFLGLTIYAAKRMPMVVELPLPLPTWELPANFPARAMQLVGQLLSCDERPVFSQFYTENELSTGPIFLPGPYRFERFLRVDSTSSGVQPLLRRRIKRWPFFVFMAGAMYCLLCSCCCHLFICHSEKLNKIIKRIDYAGIAAFIMTSFFPTIYYGFMCDSFARRTYLVAIILFGSATIVVSLLPSFQTPRYRKFRAALFFGLGFFGFIPCMHKLILYHHIRAVVVTSLYEMAMGAIYGLGALFYATRVPECWRPGKFDLAINSHQIFHILVVLGAYTHYRTGLIYLQWRNIHGCAPLALTS